MTRTLVARLARLESKAVVVVADPGIRVRFGHLKRLPPEYQGERHVIIACHLANQGNQEWVEFEEVAGPAPAEEKPLAGGPKYLDVRFV
jgi:hypothetical protein